MAGVPTTLTDDAGRVRFEGLQAGGWLGSVQLMGPYPLTAAMVATHFVPAGGGPNGTALVPLGFTPETGAIIHDVVWFTSEDWDQGVRVDSGTGQGVNVGADSLNVTGVPTDTNPYRGANLTYGEGSSLVVADLIQAGSTAGVILPVQVTAAGEATCYVLADGVPTVGHTDFYFLVSHATLVPLPAGPTGPAGAAGAAGAAGVGVPAGGAGRQVLTKATGASYNTYWATPAGGGGGGGLTIVRVPFTFDTPGIGAGIVVYVPTPGDVLLGMAASVPTTAFNGTGGTCLQIGYPADFDIFATLAVINTDAAGDAGHLSVWTFAWGNMLAADGTPPRVFLDSEPLLAWLDDGTGALPPVASGATQGEGELQLWIVPAP